MENKLTQEISEDFKKTPLEINDIEIKYIGTTSTKISSNILKHWGLDKKLILIIEFINDIDSAPLELKKEVQILTVIKTICNVLNPISEESIKLGIVQAKHYNLDVLNLKKALTKIVDKNHN